MTRPVVNVAVGVVVIVAIAWPLSFGSFGLHISSIIAVLALGVVGVDLVTRSGMLHAGYGVFFGTGAYTVAVVSRETDLPSGLGVLLGIVVAAVFAVVLGPVVRGARGYVFALVTLAASAALETIVRGVSYLGGTSGIGGVSTDLFGAGSLSQRQLYVVMVAVSVLTMYAYSRLRRSRMGRALEAVRTVPHVAEASGVDLRSVRFRVWVLSGAIGGLSGALFAVAVQFVSPDLLGVQTSVQFLVMNVVGGQGVAWGGVPGALLVRGLPSVFQGLDEYQLVLVGLATVIVVVWFPRGIAGTINRLLAWARGSDRAARDEVASEERSFEALGAHSSELVVEDVSVSFGGNKALDDVSVRVEAGAISALVGPNGSGKTTLINVLGGRIYPGQGRVLIGDRDITRSPAWQRSTLGLARTFQLVSLCDSMTAIENVMLGAHARSRAGFLRAFIPLATRREEAWLTRSAFATLGSLGVEDLADSPADQLAGGQRRLVEIARCLMTDARMILLDEPASGLNQSERERLGGTIAVLTTSGHGVLLVEHDMEFVMGLADRISVLVDGVVFAEGTADEVAADRGVAAAYFGDGS